MFQIFASQMIGYGVAGMCMYSPLHTMRVTHMNHSADIPRVPDLVCLAMNSLPRRFLTNSIAHSSRRTSPSSTCCSPSTSTAPSTRRSGSSSGSLCVLHVSEPQVYTYPYSASSPVSSFGSGSHSTLSPSSPPSPSSVWRTMVVTRSCATCSALAPVTRVSGCCPSVHRGL